jgi:hypothetical protein
LYSIFRKNASVSLEKISGLFLLGWLNEVGWVLWDQQHAWRNEEMLDRRIILKWTLNKSVCWNKLIEDKIEARVYATAINGGKFVVDWATDLIQRTTMLHGIWEWKEFFNLRRYLDWPQCCFRR